MPTLQALRAGEWPPGLHWSAGKVRTIEVEGDPPAWLEEVKQPPKKKKTPAKKKE